MLAVLSEFPKMPIKKRRKRMRSYAPLLKATSDAMKMQQMSVMDPFRLMLRYGQAKNPENKREASS
jgi:hypothetical protein